MVLSETLGIRSFRQRVSSPTTSSPTYEVVSPTSNVSSPTLISRFANVQNTLYKIDLKYIYNLPKEDIQDEWFVFTRPNLSLSPTPFEAVFQNLLNNPRIVFVEYEPAVIPFLLNICVVGNSRS